jgi:hypothetical protein
MREHSTGTATTPARLPAPQKTASSLSAPEATCDELALRQATRNCSAFGPLGDELIRAQTPTDYLLRAIHPDVLAAYHALAPPASA